MSKKRDITSFEQLHEEMVTEGLLKGRGVTVRRGSVHYVDREDVDELEVGGRVTEEWEKGR